MRTTFAPPAGGRHRFKSNDLYSNALASDSFHVDFTQKAQPSLPLSTPCARAPWLTVSQRVRSRAQPSTRPKPGFWTLPVAGERSPLPSPPTEAGWVVDSSTPCSRSKRSQTAGEPTAVCDLSRPGRRYRHPPPRANPNQLMLFTSDTFGSVTASRRSGPRYKTTVCNSTLQSFFPPKWVPAPRLEVPYNSILRWLTERLPCKGAAGCSRAQ